MKFLFLSFNFKIAAAMLLSAPGAKSSPEPKLRGAIYLESDANNIQETSSTSTVKIVESDMNGLVEAFCGAAVAISEAFWQNGGKHHYDGPDAYPQAACDAAYEQAMNALHGAYNYPDNVLFKPTLTTEPYTFRPSTQGALSYFIGTDCLLKSGKAEDQFPPGNDGKGFKEYGFALANYRDGYSGISGCTWVPNSYVEGENNGVAMGQVIFDRTEGTTTTVDKTFSFGVSNGGIVITGHHSSAVIGPEQSTQYVS